MLVDLPATWAIRCSLVSCVNVLDYRSAWVHIMGMGLECRYIKLAFMSWAIIEMIHSLAARKREIVNWKSYHR